MYGAILAGLSMLGKVHARWDKSNRGVHSGRIPWTVWRPGVRPSNSCFHDLLRIPYDHLIMIARNAEQEGKPNRHVRRNFANRPGETNLQLFS
jgi:hypothetical protein